MDDFAASLALRHTRGLGPRTWKRLLDAYGSAASAVADSASWVGRRLVTSRVRDEFNRGAWRERAMAEADRARELGLERIFYHDDAWPELLREIPNPPLFLYVLGDVSLLSRPCVAVVGSRLASGYGTAMAKSLAETLSRAGVCVVSGFAHGIDRAAHLGALRGVGGTIAVLGTGLDLVYPAANRDLWDRIASDGLIVSEFAPGSRPDGANFPHRNRIVSGISLGVVVAEGAPGSGSLITAGLALAQNREVFALPGPANLKNYKGCHQLIRQGAVLVQGGEDVLEELGPRLAGYAAPPEAPASCPEPPEEPADPDHRVLHGLLRDGEPVHVDVLARRTGWAAEKVSATLLFMELHGLVKQLPGMYYALAT